MRKVLAVTLGLSVVTVPLVLWVLPDLLDRRVRRAQQAKWDYPVQMAYQDRLAPLGRRVNRANRVSRGLLDQLDPWDQ